jgi:methionine sulfoxide reductase heme-binding subunit
MSILSAISNKITSVPVLWRRFIITGLSALPALYILQLVVRIQTGEWDLLGPEPGKALVWNVGI